MKDSLGPSRFRKPDATVPRVLDVDGVTIELGGRRINSDVTFWIPKGEFVCLCGPNGAGKSTLLKAILGIIEPTAGQVRILGEPPEKSRRRVGYVPQRKTFDRDFPAVACEVIAAALRGKWPVHVRRAERDAAAAVLERVGGAKLIDRPMAGLSGGEAQRVFLARALVTDPALLILDEPTAGVDAKGREEFIELMAQISASDELAAILVTHNVSAVSRTAERIVYLEDGKVAAWGLPAELMGHKSLTALAFRALDHHTPPDED